MAKAQHVSSINVVELLKHDFVIMPKQSVRWIELVFGEGLSAEEASHRIADEFGEQEAVAVPQHTEESEVSPETSDTEEAEAEASSEDAEDEQTASESDFEASATTDGEEG
jgi:large subunit ribosomal protein L4